MAIQIVTKYVSLASGFITFFLFIFYRKHALKTIRGLFVVIISSVFLDSLSFILAEEKITNVIYGNLYFSIQYFTVCYIFYTFYNGKLSHLAKGAIVIGVFAVAYGWLFEGPNQFQNVSWSVTNLIISTLCIGYLNHLNEFPVAHIRQHPRYWFTIGFQFYASISLMLLGASELLLQFLPAQQFLLMWMFHNMVNIFKNVCLAVAIFWSKHRDIKWDSVMS